MSWRTVAAQWPRIRASLDDGIPAPLGLVTVASANPAKLRHNHQALAFGYALSGREVTMRVYDPNSGPDDDVVHPVRRLCPGAGHGVLAQPEPGLAGARFLPGRLLPRDPATTRATPATPRDPATTPRDPAVRLTRKPRDLVPARRPEVLRPRPVRLPA